MEWVIYFFGSGAAFFVGAALVLGGIGLTSLSRWPRLQRVYALPAFVGLSLITTSAAPLPYFLYAIWGGFFVAWFLAERWDGANEAVHSRRRRWLRGLLVGVSFLGVALEAPFQLVPRMEVSNQPLILFGDSVSAGMGEASVERWPQRLARLQGIEVKDHSHMGATVRSMVRATENLAIGDGTVLLEIGGNDLLGSTPVADFERDLETLLGRVTGPGRTVVMFELPLPPFANEFGRVQRRLAAAYHVALIPKRIFVGVLTAGGGTVDSIHLSSKGHQRMQETVTDVVFAASLE